MLSGILFLFIQNMKEVMSTPPASQTESSDHESVAIATDDCDMSVADAGCTSSQTAERSDPVSALEKK